MNNISLSNVEYTKFNFKKFKKIYKTKINKLIYYCKICKSKEDKNKFTININNLFREINVILSDKNIFYQYINNVVKLLDEYIDFLKQIGDRIQNIDDEYINIAFSTIHERTESIIDNLKGISNGHTPIQQDTR